jgi:UDP-N-acetylglucosamine enolpyruvyl transferase
LCIAALGADARMSEGERGLSELRRLYHLDRGYENLVDKFRSLGARLARVEDDEADPAVLLAATQHS